MNYNRQYKSLLIRSHVLAKWDLTYLRDAVHLASHHKSIDWSKLKEFADNKINVGKSWNLL